MSRREIVTPPAGDLFRALDELAADADQILERHAELQAFHAALENGEGIGDSKQAALSEHDQKLLARCEAALARLDPDANYYERQGEHGEHCLLPAVVSVRLASVVGAFPNAAPGDAGVYVGVLLEHVCAVPGLGLIALDAACRDLVGTKTFVPTVAETLKAMREQQMLWDARSDAIWNIADRSRRIVARIEAQKGDDASN